MNSTMQQAPDNQSTGEQLSPMMRQFWDIKSQYLDQLVFFRLGDFYELFDTDAQVAARELDITLTGRPEATYPGGRVPMAGVPVKSAEVYLAKLLSRGYCVVICEQTGIVGAGKGPVERQVTRILTPGTVLESNLLPARENNYLVALLRDDKSRQSGEKLPIWGLAYVDASCGEFCATTVTEDKVLLELSRLAPKEVLVAKRTSRPGPGQPVAQDVLDVPDSLSNQFRITGRPAMFFQLEPSRRRIMQTFNVSTLEGFGLDAMPAAVGAVGAALEYLEKTQAGQMPKFTAISTYSADDYLVLDDNARRNLEITETVRDRSFEGSLLWCLDRTKTGMGSRLLRNWLLKPLFALRPIEERQEALAELIADLQLRNTLSDCLSQLADLERLSVRLSSGTINPKDLSAVGQSLSILPLLSQATQSTVSRHLAVLSQIPEELIFLSEQIDAALLSDAPRELTDGGIFKMGYSKDLDEIRQLLGGSRQWIEDYQKREQERTGIRSLKVNFNSTFGYFIEVTNANKANVPDDYIRKQTLTNAERYITPGLKEYEAKVLNAEKCESDLEYKLFVELRNRLSGLGIALKEIAGHLAASDALLSLADTARENNYVRPSVDDSLALSIEGGRHPVLERILPMGMYVSNDTALEGDSNGQQMIILTGPNMSGKSSLLRQCAHIVLLAQIGSYVPAHQARIGLVDRIFTRIGAVDDLTQGQSTFLVEMSETTQCCLSATKRSLILLDEVGRGTSTYDGVAIAWAVAEHLASSVRARTIFATHYHELNGLSNFLGQIRNYQVLVSEEDGHVEFLHRVVPGGASRSFGINVASMAGLPQQIISRAHALMNQMERRSAAAKILDGPRFRNISMDEAMQLSIFEGDQSQP